ncbi:hypothetical protein IC235_10275 [Hymenobacter sp. BT664]|uniref:Uncharacterized protein n=1 Tax=Hymenobacter montanus TaxID=2771359 RepID=A0A927GJA1_9BACT|nr:hypothetical protein [Hymenobacter montanus]MBD2768278.1 hypothetical protein [Hymenobacter montanus]
MAQVAVTYFPFQSVLGVASDTDRRLWGGVNAETNAFLSNVNLEWHGMANLKKGEGVNYYAGFGVNTNPLAAVNSLPLVNGYSFTVGARIKPLGNSRNVQVVFELAPYANAHLDGGTIRTLLGLVYNFRRRGEAIGGL